MCEENFSFFFSSDGRMTTNVLKMYKVNLKHQYKRGHIVNQCKRLELMLNKIKIKNSTFNYEIHHFINADETKETPIQGD